MVLAVEKVMPKGTQLINIYLLSERSFRNMDIEAKITFTLNVRLDICHFEVIIYPINNEVGEPWVLPTNLKQFIKQFEAFLSKVVAKYFETHERLVLRECLCEQSQSHIIDLIVSHVEMNEAFVDGNGLRNSLRSIITALIVRQVK